MKKIYLLLILTIASVLSFAQINQGGTPISFDKDLGNFLKKTIETKSMPSVDVNQLIFEDIENDKQPMPWRFGQNIPVNFGIENSGTKDVLPNGDKLWRLRIYSQGALTINLTFDRYSLPKGAKLYIYNTQKTHILGAFTEVNNQEDKVFASTLVKGEAVIIEYYEPKNVEFKGELHMQTVTHGYRGAEDFTKSLGSSGSCNNNVVCPESVGWENEIRSAVMLVSGSNGFCSGSMVNNTSNDGTPYVLTANHCYSDPSSWIFYFNWQSATCANPTSSPAHDDMSGAILRARNADSDFCLVELNQIPPLSYNIYYSGWNREDSASTNSVGIHHPSGDIKKISFDYDPSTTSDYEPSLYLADSHWKVSVWDDGTTEGGSSGSPLYDQHHRITGQLHGGWASCTSLTADFYGKFSMSWDRGGLSTNQLKNWLDPTNTDSVTINGLDPNASMTPIVNFVSDITNTCIGVINFTDMTIGTPTNWFWNFGDGTTDTLQNPTHNYTTNGVFTVILSASNSVGTSSDTIIDYITINIPNSPTVIDGILCDTAGIIDLSATANGTIYWYDTISGGTPIDTGMFFTTPIINQTTTYYVESEEVPAAIYGAKTNKGTGGYFTNTSPHGQYFDCIDQITLASVKVYASGANYRLITLEDANGTVLHQINANIPDGESRVSLNWQIPTGTGYLLKAAGAPNMWRDNSGNSYAYFVGNSVTITHSTAGSAPTGYYYYFYDWEVIEANCISTRVPVIASLDSAANASFSFVQNNLAVDFTANQIGADSYTWDFGDGTTDTIQNPQHIYSAAGTYIVELMVESSCGIDTKTDTLDIIVEINEAENDKFISIFPNPANDILTISYIRDISNIKIIDNLGNLVYYKIINSRKSELNIADITSGIYIVVIEIENRIYRSKIIVTK